MELLPIACIAVQTLCTAAQVKEIFVNMLKEMKNMSNSVRSVLLTWHDKNIQSMALPFSFFEPTDSMT